jgi:hypothetical protein
VFLSGILADLHLKVTLSKFLIPEIPGVGLLSGRDWASRMSSCPISLSSDREKPMALLRSLGNHLSEFDR